MPRIRSDQAVEEERPFRSKYRGPKLHRTKTGRFPRFGCIRDAPHVDTCSPPFAYWQESASDGSAILDIVNTLAKSRGKDDEERSGEESGPSLDFWTKVSVYTRARVGVVGKKDIAGRALH